MNRPELAAGEGAGPGGRAAPQAGASSARSSRRLAVSYSGGGFGGGQSSFFGNFSTRGDAAVSLFWELRGLGLRRSRPCGRSRAENQSAALTLVKVETQVANDVVAAYKARLAAARRWTTLAPEVLKAIESFAST